MKRLDSERADDTSAKFERLADPLQSQEAIGSGLVLGRSLWEAPAVDPFLRPVVAVVGTQANSRSPMQSINDGSSDSPPSSAPNAAEAGVLQALQGLVAVDRSFDSCVLCQEQDLKELSLRVASTTFEGRNPGRHPSVTDPSGDIASRKTI